MPETYKTGEYKGSPTFSVLTGVSKQGEEWALRQWVDKNERK